MTKFLFRYLKILVLCCLLSSAAMAAGIYDITIIPSIGPSYYSASYGAYIANAEQAIENGSSTWGTPGTPSYYYASNGWIDFAQAIETSDGVNSFHSWLGSQALAVGNYANEYGNDLYFGLKITSASQFDLSQVSFEAVIPGYAPIDMSFASLLFSANIVGIANGSPNTRYDQNNPGSAATLINDLYTSGSSLYYTETDPSNLAADIATMHSYGVVTAAYTVPPSSGMTSFDTAVPEPSTFPLLMLGCGAIVFGRFGRKFLTGRLG